RIYSDQADQLLANAIRFRDLDKHRSAELTGIGYHRVIDLDLGAHAIEIHDVLGAHHFLDLEQGGVVILKDEGDAIAHRHAALFLELDDTLPESGAFLLVALQAHDFIENHFFHRTSSGTLDERRRAASCTHGPLPPNAGASAVDSPTAT